MKSKYQTLKDIVNYVKNESDDPISELLMMGFTPCQLVYEFDFDEDDVKASELYEETTDVVEEDLDETEYPFVLDNYSPFDAALVSRFKLSPDDLLYLKEQTVYKRMKAAYEEEMLEVSTDVMNEVFDKFEDDIDVGE